MSKSRNKDILNSITIEKTPISFGWSKGMIQANETIFLSSFMVDNDDIISLDEARRHVKDNRVSLKEAKIRKECPSLQILWEEYQTMLALVRDIEI